MTRIISSASRFANKHGIYMGKRSAKVHAALYRRSNGKIGGHLPGSPKAKILLLDHVGAKSGLRRTSPLMYYAGDNFVAVVASKAGQPTHPAWFHNLKANPDTTIRIGQETRPVRARVATDAERAQLWPEFVAFFPDYDFYQHLAKDRKIPIMILDPR
ncbi:nitroreductase family deazaflavin-dependent oxidoreductase [Nocardia altamirensis]|uniref:nitroreductase family deazaflavin-dependent oxidoreductase n=1 Tax=Nocardia altamirensis TaxID=472158 RepID=UPI001FDF076E|nr:nitroreductase family deazaflavin-dependent oxidoreductase [Nocardia altamirensis]